MIYVPRLYQGLIRRFGLDHRRCNIWAGMGLGKTAAALDIYDTKRIFGEARRLLVIGPKRVAKSAWKKELAKWSETFGHLSMAICVGTPDERKAALAQQADITTVNYETIEWLVEGYGDRWPFDMVIADESTRLKGLRIAVINAGQANEHLRGQGSVRAKALKDVAFRHVNHWINLTASPAPNGIIDLWGQNWFVDAGQRLGTSFSGFRDRWFYTIQNDEGYHIHVPKQFAQPEIEGLMRDCAVTIATEDYFPVEKTVESTVFIDLPPRCREQYMKMEKQFFAEINEHRIDVFAQGAKAQKLLQMANGAVWVDRDKGHWEKFHDQKIEALASVLEEANGDPVLIRYCSVPDKIRILDTFKQVKFFDEKPETEDAWNRGEYRGLLTHAKSTGHGLNLQDGGRILCDYSSEYNHEEDEQILERIGPVRQAQSGHPRSVYRRRIVARDTLEEHSVLPKLFNKWTIQESLKHAMKIRG